MSNNILASFKKISPKSHGAEILMINKAGKGRAQRYAVLSKAAATRAQNLQYRYIEILFDEKNRVLGLHLTNEKTEYSTKITKAYRIAAEGAWKRLESMGIELNGKYILEWNDSDLCWTTQL